MLVYIRMGFEDFPTTDGTPPDMPVEQNELEDLGVTLINPADQQAIADYYRFEVDQKFSEINHNTTFEKMIAYRQFQIRENKLQVCIARDGTDVVGTTTVALESGTR